MERLEHIDRFIGDAASAQSPADLLAALRSPIERLGFEKFTYSVRAPVQRPDERFFISTYPAAWLERYHEQDYRRDDPIFHHARTSLLPFLWHEVADRTPLTLRQRRLFSEAAEFGLRSIGTVPLHGPGSVQATLAIISELPEAEFAKLFAVARHELTLLALYAHEHLLQYANVVRRASADLSVRERDVLTWTARGKTRWEIASILGLSDDTVKEYLTRAGRKLNAANKTHAVVMAFMRGLIRP